MKNLKLILILILCSFIFSVGLIPTLLTLLLFAGLLIVLIVVNQDSLLYIPVVMGYKKVLDNPEGFRSPGEHGIRFSEFLLPTRDGERIHGWYIPHPNPVATVLFCHENAGNIGLRISNFIQIIRKLKVNLICFDYRGYGDSTGRPSEAGLIVDTETVFNYIKNELKISNIFIYGRSLGGAVALQFAAIHAGDPVIKGVVIENTFLSISEMVGQIFPFLNFNFIKNKFIKSKWKNFEWIRAVSAPILLLSGGLDEIVPPTQMKALFRICQSDGLNSEFHLFPTGTHNDTWIQGGEEYWRVQLKFMEKNKLV